MNQLSDQKTLLDAEGMDRALVRMTHEILEANRGAKDLCLVGIERGGGPLAHRLAERVHAIEGVTPPIGSLDITLYRDDLGAHAVPQVGPTRITFPITGKAVVLVDDVLYTGRTVRAALDELVDFGRPRRVYLACLVERSGRELPVQPDFVGKHVVAGPGENIEVRLRERHGADEVVLQRRG
jgi:pyrimidine operon attenuation protein/uracil phosphoribosyltransferase